MSLFLKPAVLAEAVDNIKVSSARSRILEFLILKRTLVLDDKHSVVFAESSSNYRKSISELAHVGLFAGAMLPDAFKYINVSAIDKTTTPYRSNRFTSNGPNTTVGGNTWAKVVELNTTTMPRTVNLTSDYLSQAAKFFLHPKGKVPSIIAFAFWYYRHIDLSVLLGSDSGDLEKSVEVLREDVITSFNFSDNELAILFDDSDDFIKNVIKKHGSGIFADTVADASEYLAPPIGRIKKGTGEHKPYEGDRTLQNSLRSARYWEKLYY